MPYEPLPSLFPGTLEEEVEEEEVVAPPAMPYVPTSVPTPPPPPVYPRVVPPTPPPPPPPVIPSPLPPSIPPAPAPSSSSSSTAPPVGEGGIVVPPSIVITDGQRFETEQLQDESSMDGVRQSGGTETGEQQIGEQQIGEEQIGDQQMVDPQSGEQQTGEPQTGEQEMWGIRDGGRVVASGTISAPLRRSTRITRGIPPLKYAWALVVEPAGLDDEEEDEEWTDLDPDVTGEWQSTLGAPVAVSGVGLHLGLPTTVTLLPAPAASGRVFHVVLGGDGGGGEVDRVATGAGREGRVVEIGADVWSVVDTRLCTVLAAASATPSSPPSSPDESPAGGEREQSEVRLGTVEHLLSALEGCGVDNCVIRVEGAGEMPLLDGSAAEWVEHIMAAGIHPATLHRSNGTTGHAATGDAGAAANDAVTVERRRWNLPGNQPITVQHGDSFIAAFPRASPLLTYGIDFPHVPAIGRQWVSWEPCRSQQPAQARAAERRQGGGEEPGGAAEQPVGAAAQGEHGEHGEQGQECGDYVSGIAPARTFCILEQVEQMRAAGLIRGGSLDNALVCSQARGWVNPPLRLPLEPCRHKLLDLIGDLALCARGGNAGIPNAHIVAYKASHALHVAFGKALMGALEAEAKGRGGAGNSHFSLHHHSPLLLFSLHHHSPCPSSLFTTTPPCPSSLFTTTPPAPLLSSPPLPLAPLPSSPPLPVPLFPLLPSARAGRPLRECARRPPPPRNPDINPKH
ncbi:unnamed protein product [Closterium sp. NIES-65]|nr:unnamed protein product [Closterium sp. NIES-65]